MKTLHTYQENIIDAQYRIEDLASYIDDLENALESIKDAKNDLECYIEPLSGADKIMDNLAEFAKYVPDLEKYIFHHRDSFAYEEERLFAALQKHLELFSECFIPTPEKQTNAHTGISLTLSREQWLELFKGAKVEYNSRFPVVTDQYTEAIKALETVLFKQDSLHLS